MEKRTLEGGLKGTGNQSCGYLQSEAGIRVNSRCKGPDASVCLRENKEATVSMTE